MCTYKSFCWSLGTTSFRTSDFNKKIERQLYLLSAFRKQHSAEPWKNNAALQELFYDFMKGNGFLSGNAPRKDKDAREKTSGLCNLGLITEDHRLTPAGEKLLFLSQNGAFGTDDNLLHIPADSFLYFKQLLKTSVTVDGCEVRPFAVLAILLGRLGHLTYEEFTYLLPLVTSPAHMQRIIIEIPRLRDGQTTIDNIIMSILMGKDNYQEALNEFLLQPTSKELLCKVGMNRKSNSYDRPYYTLYLALRNLQRDNAESLAKLLKACRKINIGSYWVKLLFAAKSEKAIRRSPETALNDMPLLECSDEKEFKTMFFRFMHLFKAKATLYDYRDLNRRYFNITNTVTFGDGKVEFTLLARCLFSICSDGIERIAFTRSPSLDTDNELADIIPHFSVTTDDMCAKLRTDYGINATSADEVQTIVDNERRKRFDRLIDTRFSDDVLLGLLDNFEKRNDDSIRGAVCNNADVPTIFEYIVGVIWYKISNRHGDILSAMNLSLDADMLPRTHAAGGREDITYHYEACKEYGAHTLLIEATLSDGNNQRRMEMEPVSRHLGDYLLHHSGEEAYAMFVTTFLHINVLADFRARKNTFYYSADEASHIEGMKIIPVQTDVLKTILRRQLKYPELYAMFATAHNTDMPPKKWYDSCIAAKAGC